jgi:hypothetical protein
MRVFGRKAKPDNQEDFFVRAFGANPEELRRRGLDPQAMALAHIREGLEKEGRSSVRFGVLLAAFGLAVSVATLVGGLHERALTGPLSGGRNTTGRIVSADLLGCRGGCEWQIVVSFAVPGRGSFSFEPPHTTRQPVVDSTVNVSYLPSHPSTARDTSDVANDGTTLLWISPLGVALGVLCGLPMILLDRKQARS